MGKLCCRCMLYVSLPHDAVGWSAVCDWGISWSCSLTFGYNRVFLKLGGYIAIAYNGCTVD